MAQDEKRRKEKEQQQKEEEEAAAKVELDADLTPEEIQMMQAMGIPFAFNSTAGKHVSA